MSLPNDDEDQNGRQPWKDPFGHRDETAISPTKKPIVAPSDTDDRTADETSVGSMSFTSDITSVVAPGATAVPATPLRQGPARERAMETPISALTTTTTSAESDDVSIQSGVSFNTEDGAAMQLRRERNRRQLQVLGGSTAATFALFVYMLVPTALLLSMILFGSVSSAFLYRLATVMQWEFHRSILEGRGIGDYLPENLYQLLTSQSIHEILSDPDGIFGPSEHLPYLMLYMIPGLTPEQIDQYVNRLAPAHQRLLRSEQGVLGFLLNYNNHRLSNPSENPNRDSTLMRFIMGDERLRDWRQQQHSRSQNPSNISPRQLDLPPTIPEEEAPTTPTRSNTVNASEPAGIPETVATVVGRASVPNPQAEATTAASNGSTQSPATTSSPNRRASALSEMVLFDAVGDAVSGFVSDTTNSVRERAQETFRDTLATPMYRVSLGVAALGLGVGAFGLANGTYDLQSLAQPFSQFVSNFMTSLLGGSSSGSGPSSSRQGSSFRLSLTMPSGSVLVGSTIASGTTAVVLGLFGTTTPSSSDAGDTPQSPPPAATTNGGEAPSKR